MSQGKVVSMKRGRYFKQRIYIKIANGAIYVYNKELSETGIERLKCKVSSRRTVPLIHFTRLRDPQGNRISSVSEVFPIDQPMQPSL